MQQQWKQHTKCPPLKTGISPHPCCSSILLLLPPSYLSTIRGCSQPQPAINQHCQQCPILDPTSGLQRPLPEFSFLEGGGATLPQSFPQRAFFFPLPRPPQCSFSSSISTYCFVPHHQKVTHMRTGICSLSFLQYPLAFFVLCTYQAFTYYILLKERMTHCIGQEL